MTCQLEFFNNEITDLDMIRSDVQSVKESNDKVRKSMFARHGELAKKYCELSERL